MADLQLTAQPRSMTGRKVRQLRREGVIPVVVYGKSVDAQPLQVDERSLERVLHHGGMSQLVEVSVNGAQHINALIRSVQRHPVTHRLEHVDLYAVNMREKQHVSVPLEAHGKASGLVTGFIMLQMMDHITIEALPSDIPARIEVDVTPLTQDRPITVADLPNVNGVSYLAEADEVIFSLNATRVQVEEEVEEEAAAEPEVVGGRGKRDEDEDEE